MAHAGQVLKTGALTLTVRRCDPEALEMVAVYPPASPEPPEHYERLAELAEEGRPLTDPRRNLLQTAVLMAEYDGEVRLTKPPRAVQKLVMWVLAPVGWLLGYRAHPLGRGDA